MPNARIRRDIVLVQALASMGRGVRRSSLLILKSITFPQKSFFLLSLSREEHYPSAVDCGAHCRRDQRLA